jgi:hypothetical protein
MSYQDEQMWQTDPSGMGRSQSSASLSVPAGAIVYDVAGDKLGKVSGGIAFGEYFRLEKGLLFPHEYYVPKSAIARIAPMGSTPTSPRTT